MRLIVVHHSLDENGGARIAAGVASHRAANGDDVWLAGVTRTGEWHYPVDERVRVLELTIKPQLASALRVWIEAVPRFRKLVRDVNPDVIVSIGTLPNFVSFVSKAGRPLIVNEQTDPRVMAGRRHSLVRNLGYRFGRVDAFVVLTQDTANLIGSWKAPSTVHVVPNPATRTADERADTANSRQVLAMGRLLPQKGFDVLLPAWAHIVGDHPGWRLVIAGEGDGRAEFEALALQLGVADSVEFPGFVRDPFALMARSALFVLSSRYEGFPLALIEAMAAGLPVVSTDCPTGPADIVHDGVDGFLVPVGDVDALAKRMRELMSDSALRETMGPRAQAAVERFRPEAVWRMWDAVIDSVRR